MWALDRVSDAAGAGGSGLGGLRALAVGPDKLLQIGVLFALQVQLFTPRGGHHRGVKVRVGTDKHVVVALGEVSQTCYLVLREVGAVGDPDRPVLEGVDGGLAAYGFFVETAVLPDGVVLSPDRGTLCVV